MRTTTALATALVLAYPALPADASSTVSLWHVAAAGHYQHHWSTVGSSVVLSRPGTYVVLTPGSPVYQVNDHNEVTQDAPVYANGDLYVDSALARHLENLPQRKSPTAAWNTGTTPADRSEQGAISLEARQLQGAEAIDVTGAAPAGAQVTLTLLALLSPDIPTVLVSRHDVVSDVNGRFRAVVPIASAYERGTILQVVATSAPGVASAQAQLTTGAPNAGASVPLFDNW